MNWQYWLVIALLIVVVTVFILRLVRGHIAHKRIMRGYQKMFDDLAKGRDDTV